MVWAAAAGLLFGVFQAFNRRANQLVDAYRGAFALILISAISVGIVAALTQDLSLLSEAPATSFLFFLGAGAFQFFVAWTFLGLSQQRIGASSTGVVIAAAPIGATILAALVLSEPLPALTVLGVLLAAAGVALISLGQGNSSLSFGAVPWFALGCVLCWSISPLLIRLGLEELPSPLIGVTVGLIGAATLYGVFLALGGGPSGKPAESALPWLLLAGVVVAGAITSQWTSFDLIEISVAVTLLQLAVPTVVLLAPLVVRTEAERITPALVGGMGAVLAGSILVIWAVQA
ncbi:MAG: DMT family transporter [Acidimicrobiia bacterium]